MPTKYIVKDQETGKEYQRGGNGILSSYTHNGAICWQYDHERNVSLDVARILLTDFDTGTSGYYLTNAENHAYTMAMGALECLLWSESDNPDERDDSSLGDNGCCAATLDKEDWYKFLGECGQFLMACEQYGVRLHKAGMDQHGHDFILTRNGHGTGFWDREELYGRDYLFLSFVASQYPTIHGQRDGLDWSIHGLTGQRPQPGIIKNGV